jgi:hypothetical protein
MNADIETTDLQTPLTRAGALIYGRFWVSPKEMRGNAGERGGASTWKRYLKVCSEGRERFVNIPLPAHQPDPSDFEVRQGVEVVQFRLEGPVGMIKGHI